MEPLADSTPPGNNNPSGYLKFVRSQESLDLLRDPTAFTLLATIAIRARWRSSGLNVDDVQLGEALIGDFKQAGMTRGEYREATKRLAKHRLATFRTTNRGTYAKLANTKVFDINGTATQDPNNQRNDQRTASQQPASNQPATNEQPLTKKERREESKQETLSPSLREESEWVGKIYEAYPKKAAKPDALRAIRKALQSFPADFLLERTKLFATKRPDKNDRYTPHPATWFNRQQFNDDPGTWTPEANGSAVNGKRNGQFQEHFSRTLQPMTVGGSRKIGSCL